MAMHKLIVVVFVLISSSVAAHAQATTNMGKDYCPTGTCNRAGVEGGRMQLGVQNCKPCGKQTQNTNSPRSVKK
jgi:hypothetical protein